MHNITDNDKGLALLIMFLLCVFLAGILTACGTTSDDQKSSFSFSDYCEPIAPDEEAYPDAQIAYNEEGGIIGWYLYGSTYKDLCSDVIFTIEMKLLDANTMQVIKTTL